MPALLVAAIGTTRWIHPDFGAFEIQTLALGALPLALAAAAQAIVVISGGIDLSIGSMIAVANVLSASLMVHATFAQSLMISLLVLAAGAALGLLNGLVVAVSRIPDVVATLTTGFIWGGVALLILERPGGGAPPGLSQSRRRNRLWALAAKFLGRHGHRHCGDLGADPIEPHGPSPLRRRKRSGRCFSKRGQCGARPHPGLRFQRAHLRRRRNGPDHDNGNWAPLAGAYYTLSSVAAVVIGGVSLAGGRGGMVGPVIAALLLTLAPMDLVFLGIDPNYGQVIQGSLIVLVVMIAGFFAALQERK